MKRVSGLADETVIVDTGSTDGTVEMAQKLGAVVVNHPWDDDFSEVRNVSIQHSRGDWILALDADEAIHPGDFPIIRQTIAKGKSDAYRLMTSNYSDVSSGAGWTPCNGQYAEMEDAFTGWFPTVKVRLFKRNERIRFIGSVHELAETTVLACGGTIDNCAVPIRHYGAWDMEFRKTKGGFYLRLVQKKIAQMPRDPRAHFELGIQYFE